MIVQIVRYASGLGPPTRSLDGLKSATAAIERSRPPAEVLRTPPGQCEHGGIYIWDSRESLGPVVLGISPAAGEIYQVADEPSGEIVDVMLVLHSERLPA